jgi:hypothetical protein
VAPSCRGEHVLKETDPTSTSLPPETNPIVRVVGCGRHTTKVPIVHNKADRILAIAREPVAVTAARDVPAVGRPSVCPIWAAVDGPVLVIVPAPIIALAIVQTQEARNGLMSEADVRARVVELDRAGFVPRSRGPKLVDPVAVDLPRARLATSSASHDRCSPM